MTTYSENRKGKNLNAFSLYRAAIFTKNLPHQNLAWDMLQDNLEESDIREFRVRFQDKLGKVAPQKNDLVFALSKAAFYTNETTPHQEEAWFWMENKVSDTLMLKFKQFYQNNYRTKNIKEQYYCPEQALNIIKHFEGFRAEPYLCPAGVWTIGYGTVRYPDGTAVTKDDALITEEKAVEYLMDYVVERIIKTLVQTVPQYTAMNTNMHSALISFAYNLGADFMTASSGFNTIQTVLNKKQWSKVPSALWLYRKASGQELPGLARRRKAEGDLWNGIGEFAIPTV